MLVDGAQSVPHFPVDVNDPRIDFLAFSGHKLYGPSGIGVLYGRRELLESMDPFLTGGHMIDRVYRDHATWAALPAKFEAGTLPIAQGIALGTAVDYVNGIGFDAICEHEDRLLHYAHERLRRFRGLRNLRPRAGTQGIDRQLHRRRRAPRRSGPVARPQGRIRAARPPLHDAAARPARPDELRPRKLRPLQHRSGNRRAGRRDSFRPSKTAA